MEYLYFKTHKQFYDWLVANGVKLDMSKTCSLSRYSVSISNEIFFHNRLVDMLVTLNKHLPSDKQLNEKVSTIKGTVGYLLYFKSASDEVAAVVTEDLFEEDTFQEDLIQEQEDNTSNGLQFDLDYALSLQEGKSKKDAKDALELYGREFNVELAKNKKFEDMIEDLKDLLSK